MASASIQHWALTLSNYQYHLHYKPGTKLANADGLSRLPLSTPAPNMPVPEEAILSFTTLNNKPVTAAKVAQWTDGDPVLSAVVTFVLQGWPLGLSDELSQFYQRKDELSVQQGCLLCGVLLWWFWCQFERH